MANRTQIVCLHEGKQGRSIDPVFINALLKALRPAWIRAWGSPIVRTVDCGGRTELINRMPIELKVCLSMGGDTTLMVWADLDQVWADLDHDMPDGDTLKEKFRQAALSQGVAHSEFDQVVFIFAKDRLENWIEFLLTGKADESREGPRVKHNREVAEAAKTLAERCRQEQAKPPLPLSLKWSCRNWKNLVERMVSA